MEKLAQKNAAFVLDVLSGRLAFERTGVKLYDTVIEKIERHAEPRYHAIVGQLREIRAEEKEHEEWLEQQIRALGGNPDENTDMAQLESEESTGIKNVIVDGHQKAIHLVHALLAAELADNAGWDVLVKLADEAGDMSAKAEFAKRLAEEAKHLLFIREVVLRAAEVEILGRDIAMPKGMRGVVGGTIRRAGILGSALGGFVAAAFIGLGALAASALFIARPRLALRSKLALKTMPLRSRFGMRRMRHLLPA
jgi:bacterioferritin (cytochrome b1)